MAGRKVNVLHIMTRLPVGGVENQLLQVIRHYDRERFSPLVCSLTDRGEIGREIEKEGVEVICLNKLGHRFRPSIVSDLRGILKDRGIVVVRTHQYHANLYGRVAARLAGVPCIVASVHNIYTRDKKPHRRFFNRLLARHTDRVVAVSEAVRADILKYDGIPAEKVAVIYNGVHVPDDPLAPRAKARTALGLPQDALVVGTVGRLAEQKGQKYLIEAASRLVADFPSLRLLIVGDGPSRAELEGLSKGLGVNGRTIFTGTRRDVPDMLSAMDVFVMPSLWEGLGIALIEAMACGKPVVATDIPPFREIITSPDYGILTPLKEAAALAGAVRGLLESDADRSSMGRRASEEAARRFDIRRTVAAYQDMFTAILEGKGAASC